MWNNIDVSLIDDYVLAILKNNGWSEKRDFNLADSWISEIEHGGFRCFHCAKTILHSFGGIKIREYSPKSAESFLKTGRFVGDRRIETEKCLHILKILKAIQGDYNKYTGAAFTFDALDAFYDQEIVLNIEIVESVVKGNLFPIGTVEPDGISYVSEDGHIYTVFNDSIFSSGERIEDYISARFIKHKKPKLIYMRNVKEN